MSILKSILFYTLLCINLCFLSCKKENKNQLKENKKDYNIPKSTKDFVFNNELRTIHGMPKIDSSRFIGYYSNESKKSITFERKTINKSSSNKINKLFFKPYINNKYAKDTILISYYNIGIDSVLSIQSRIQNKKYLFNNMAVKIIIKDTVKYILYDEIMDIAKKKGLLKEGDTLFYGAKTNTSYEALRNEFILSRQVKKSNGG